MEYRFLVYAIVLGIIIVGAYYPVALPLIVTDYVQGFHDVLEAVPDGSYVLVPTSMRVVYDYNEMYSADVAVWKRMLQKDFKILSFVGYEISNGWMVQVITEAMGYDNVEDMLADPRYGTNVVYLGYLPGGDALNFPSILEDVTNVASVDAWGNSLSDYNRLPMMAGISAGREVELVVGGIHYEDYVAVEIYNLPIIIGPISTGDLSAVVPFWRSGQIKGALVGLRSAAEYEAITGFLGMATNRMFQSTAVTAFVIIGMITSTVIYFVKRATGTKKEAS